MKILKKIRTIFKILIINLMYRNRVEIGKSFGIMKGFNIVVEENGKVNIGDNVFFNNYCSINCLGTVKIGDNTIFGEGVKLYDHNHRYKDKNGFIKNQGFNIGKITIGKNCWIGSNTIILNNVEIGDNVVIGANCLIYKSIPDNSIVKNNSSLSIEKYI